MAKKWMQEASDRMEAKGTKGTYGHKSVKQMKKDKAKGGHIAQQANFALNARKAHHGGKRGKRHG